MYVFQGVSSSLDSAMGRKDMSPEYLCLRYFDRINWSKTIKKCSKNIPKANTNKAFLINFICSYSSITCLSCFVEQLFFPGTFYLWLLTNGISNQVISFFLATYLEFSVIL